jgi:hypothetical protein
MKKLAIAILLLSSPAAAETITIVGPRPVPGSPDAPCYPIGKTDDGHFVYSMDCRNIPTSLPQPTDDSNAAPPSDNR